MSKLLTFRGLFVVALLAGGGYACPVARAAPAEAAGDAQAHQLVQEFDLTPQLLGASQQKSGGDPLKAISGQMTVIHHDLSQWQTDKPVQAKSARSSNRSTN